MSRIPYITPEGFTEVQQKLFDNITGGKRGEGRTVESFLNAAGGLDGPFNAWLFSPALGEPTQRLGAAVRFESTLPPQLRELAILMVAVKWQAQFEWWAHEIIARETGLDAGVIASLKAGRLPAFTQPSEAVVYHFAQALLNQQHVSDQHYQAALELLGEAGVVELVILLGYYTLISMTLNTFEVPVPEGETAPFAVDQSESKTDPMMVHRQFSQHLKDKIAIVVGAGQTAGATIGNGKATALRFAQEGARVLLVDRRVEVAAETAQQIAVEGGIASVLGADITCEEDCQAIVATCLERYGRIDILHNNVGIMEGDSGTLDLTAGNWSQIMDVNLKGMFLTCKHVLPVMRSQQAGAIINISSTASVSTRPTLLAYKASKAGVNAITQNMAIENAPYGVRVNAILPGLMDTPMAIKGRMLNQGLDEETLRQQRHNLVPLKQKMGSAWDVAAAAVFLASDEAQYITGALLPVDGGLSSRVG